MKTMKGIIVRVFGTPEVLNFEHLISLPKNPIGRQLTIQVKSVGVNPVDTYIRGGLHHIKPTLPYTPGVDGSGIVTECGENVSKFKKGDRVYFCRTLTGSYAQFCNVEEHYTFHLHDSLTFEQGASLGVPYFTAYRALVTKAHLKAGQTVLIHGASGAVGMACCQIAKYLGARIYGTAGTEEGLEFVRFNGAEHVFNHRTDLYLQEIKDIVKDGVDVIVEMLANKNLEKDLEIIGSNGTIVIVGSRGPVSITPRNIMMNEVSIHGVQLFKTSELEWQEMGDFFEEGQQCGRIIPKVGKTYTLSQAALAHKEVIDHESGTKGKIILNID